MIPTDSRSGFGTDRLPGDGTDRRYWLAAVALSALAGVAVLSISLSTFPYHSLNHDEAVYLQQAAMLLHGQAFLHPPVEDAFRPWFFVDAGSRLYPKYAPVPAAVFAAGKLLGSYRIALVGVATAVVGLTYAVVAELFDRRTGLLAATLLVLSPLFLVQSALFLPYAPTTALNLCFAYGYLRADRTGSRRWAAVAGVAVGLAFFARPYTAVLFAAPWIAHAGWTLRTLDRETWVRQSTTAALGLAGVAVALGYNALVTGSPFLFPYEAFAPLDGLGFGYRRILGHDVNYTPALALRANAEVLTHLFSRWVSAGPLGTALAALGLARWVVRSRRGGVDPRKAALAGLFLTVAAGNVYFWGNYNVLGTLAVPDDGLVHYLGPYYHFDLLVPTAAFAAHGGLWVADRYRGLVDARISPRWARPVAVAGLVVGAAVLAGAGGYATAGPIADDRAVTDHYRAAYAPFENRDLSGSVVFLPEPYGPWLGHPFQALRNDPGFDGETVYALRGESPAVSESYPDRRLYRYAYRGEWSPTDGPPVDARLQRVRRVAGDRVVLNATLGVPETTASVSLRVGTGEGSALYAVRPTGDAVSLSFVLADGEVSVRGPVERVGDGDVTLPDTGRVTVAVFLDHGTGYGSTYRIELPVRRAEGRVHALSPYLELCRGAGRCGERAAYRPDRSPDGTSMNVSISTADAGDPASIRSPPRSLAGMETHNFRTT